MTTSSPQGITQLLERWSQGDKEALDQLMPLVYNELHRLAGAYLRRERGEHTLQPTALVNEVYLKLINQHHVRWQNRAQFFGVAAQLMRRILVDHARANYAAKRGGDRVNVSLKNTGGFWAPPGSDGVALKHVLKRRARISPDA